MLHVLHLLFLLLLIDLIFKSSLHMYIHMHGSSIYVETILDFHPIVDNAIPIKSWFADPSDTALLNLLPMLDALRFVSDVRSILSRNLHLHSPW